MNRFLSQNAPATTIKEKRNVRCTVSNAVNYLPQYSGSSTFDSLSGHWLS
jgi:hypothetical protein